MLHQVTKAIARRSANVVLLGSRFKKRACVALILREQHDGVEMLFVRRAINPRDRWSGQMAFPGGRQDPKETDRETVQRETLEEIGLDLCSKAGYIGQLDDAQASENLSVGVYVYRLAPSHVDVEFQLDPSEISDVLWVKFDYFLTNPIQQVITLRLVDFAEHLRPMEWLLRYCRMDRIDFPCIYLPRPKEVQIHETKRHMQDYVLWGFSLGVLSQFFQHTDLGSKFALKLSTRYRIFRFFARHRSRMAKTAGTSIIVTLSAGLAYGYLRSRL